MDCRYSVSPTNSAHIKCVKYYHPPKFTIKKAGEDLTSQKKKKLIRMKTKSSHYNIPYLVHAQCEGELKILQHVEQSKKNGKREEV